ncbi:MAG TPA: ABC transporter permease [Planctomycetaceae bacterium]|jgi:ABC-2 type transport system permease protein|nr:ABC transporter permease [Planctomycetaceae bacterium]
MYKAFVIAGREYNAAVKTRAFLISLVVFPILIGGAVFMQWMLRDQVDTSEKRFAIIDRTPKEKLVAALTGASESWNKNTTDQSGKQVRPKFAVERVAPSADNPEAIAQQRFDLSERVRKGTLFGFMEIGGRVFETADSAQGSSGGKHPPSSRIEDDDATSLPPRDDRFAIRYQSSSPNYDAFRNWASPVINKVVRDSRYAAEGLPADKVRAAVQRVPLANKGLTQRNPATGQFDEARDENPIVSFLAPGGLLMLMFMLILLGSTPLMQGVVEEKMQRIAEVLLGSVRPFDLMVGKLLGLVGVSVTLATVYLSGAYWAAHHYGYAELVSIEVLVWFLVYLVLGVLMYGSLFITVGAACSDLRETQAMLWPVMLLAMLPMFCWANVVREPNSAFSTFASFVPNATPMLMLVRVAVPPGIAWWQPAVGMFGVLAATLVCIYAAGRVFRVGLLSQGKAATPREMLRWIFES